MKAKAVERTLELFLKAWEEKSIEKVVNLLAPKFRYFETPLEKPLTTKNQIRKLWAPVPKFEAEVKLSYKTLSISGGFGIFRINGTYEHNYDKKSKITKIDRIFLLKVNNNGQMTEFIQWRESKDFEA